MDDELLDEALTRLHRYGPEFDGFLSNHGPMVVEALSRRSRSDAIEGWTDRYVTRLEDAPRPGRVIGADGRGEALGDMGRAADWTATAAADLSERHWTEVLAAWWPWLLPGIAAGATHGVIRVGHAVRALRSVESAARVAELAHALGYWAARWRPVPISVPRGARTAAQVLPILPTVPDQSGGFTDRAAQLTAVSGLVDVAAQLAAPGSDVPGALEKVIDAAVTGYAGWAVGGPTLLVHAATAPNAVLATLPSLPEALWPDSFAAAWSASAAIIAAYRPPAGAPVPGGRTDDAFDHAVAEGSEHMIKFADTAVASYRRTGDPVALAAVEQAIRLHA